MADKLLCFFFFCLNTERKLPLLTNFKPPIFQTCMCLTWLETLNATCQRKCLCFSHFENNLWTYTGEMASDILLCCVGIGCGVTLLKPALLDVLSPFTGVTAPLRDNTPVGVNLLNTSEIRGKQHED